VGKTGCGKTTITNLINRFYEIQQGEILLDGVNIKNINKRSLRAHIGIILQDPFIFARSIANNIKLNNSNITEEDIVEAVRLSSADGFVSSLPNGICEIAKERGSSFSAGEKQLLAFARIFAHNPSIFILDEATANIDTHTERLIQKSIDTISKEKTSIFIAHRLATIVNVDKIIVLDAGEIVEMGNHIELLKTGGYYSKLYNSYYESLN
jgi:ATP-binding cassette subfamily B multidrug efflux pump